MEEKYELAIEEAAMKLALARLFEIERKPVKKKKLYCVSQKEMMYLYHCIQK